MCRPSSPRGFILPTTLLVMALLTVMLTAAFVLVSAEHRTSENALASTRALLIAQSGLQKYFSRSSSIATNATYDSVASYPMPGGYATVAASRLVPATGSQQALWIVRSYGYATSGLLSGEVQARRAVAQLTTFNPGQLPVQAALTAVNATQVRPWFNVAYWYPNPIDGDDDCGSASRDTTGLVFASGDYTSTSSPPGPGPQNGTVTLGSRSEVYDSTHVDWASLFAGNFTPDYDVTAGTWPSSPSGWPIYYADGSLTLYSGTPVQEGVLVIRSDLYLAPGARWRGVIIIGGRVITSLIGGYRVRGAIISGLNEIGAPGSVLPNQLYRTQDSDDGIHWHSCNVVKSQEAMNAFSPIRGAWTDQWSLY